MVLTNFGIAPSAPQSAASAVAGTWPNNGALAVILTFVLILVWSAAVRLPFYGIANGDEFFFSVVAREWLHGGLPYVDAFDIKPPGLFLIYAIAQTIFGDSYATFKGMEIVAVASGALLLFVMLRPFGAGRLAIWVAALYPVYTLAFDGTAAVNMLLQLPFVIAAFAAVAAATRDGATTRRRLTGAFLAGLAIGSAGMIKQTAVFEATAAFIMLGTYGERDARLRMLALFVVGAALPALSFSAYFLALGHFRELFNDVIVLALRRLDPDVVASYGPKLSRYLTLPGALENSILRSSMVIFLWVGAIFTLLRLELVKPAVPARLLVIAATWLAFSLASAVYGRLLCDYYLLGIVPPLLILAGAFFCYGLRIAPARRSIAFCASIIVAGATLLSTQHRELFGRDLLAVDRVLTARAVDAFHKLGLKPDDRLLVLNRGLELFTATGLRPPSPYFHTTHLMSAFQTSSPNSLGDALNAHPRFIVLADPSVRHITELPARLKRAQDYLAAHYRIAAVVHGAWDSFTIYEFVG
jgi:hypothetical protein